jgi:uncharacterized protein (DUF2141 family)
MIGSIQNRRRRSVFALVVAALSAPAPALATDLRVTITAIRSGDGNVHVSVYDRPEAFPKSTGMLMEQVVKAQAPTLVATFTGLAPGAYAVAAFHDENGNGKFDQGFLGIPLEDYGFSNDPKVILSAPDFEQAAFVISGDEAHIAIRLKR